MALRNQEIGGRLRELRGEKPQTAVADELGVAERTYQNWEAGDAKPSYRNLQRLARYHGVTEEYILAGTPLGLGDKAATPDPFPLAVEPALTEILAAIKAQLAEQTQVLNDVKQLLLDVQDATATQAAAAVQMQAATDLLNTLQPLEPVQEPAESQPKAG